jgi:cytochrome c2
MRRSTALALAAFLLLPLSGCGDLPGEAPGPVAGAAAFGGDPATGARRIAEVGCGACHMIPGIPGARGLLGPPLHLMGRRVFVAGLLRNTPENMITWLMNPQRIVPGVAMPDLGLDEQQARDIAAYLYTLR